MPADFNEVAGEVHEFPSLEVEGVHVGVETLSHTGIEVVLSIREGGTWVPPYAGGTRMADQSVAPVDRIHERTAYGRVGVLNEVGV